MKRIGHLAVLLVLLAACARQGVIPNPDKFPPHLVSATSVNQTQLNLRFDEALESSLILPSTFTLGSTQGTAEIRFVAKDPNDSQGRSLMLITSPLVPGKYTITGLVADTKDNAANIQTSFRASEKRDTLPPYLTLLPFEDRTTFPYVMKMESAEPIDTTNEIMMFTAPFELPSTLTKSWNSDHTQLEITCNDTTFRTCAFYLVLLPGITDFTGNRTAYGISKLVYSDTTILLYPLFGRILTEQGKKAVASLVIFKHSGKVFAGVLADTVGSFATRLAEHDSVEIGAYFDHEGDGVYEESSRTFYLTLPDSVTINTQSAPQPLNFEQIKTPAP